jgi:ribosomal protein S12 methylthiotransferase
MLYIYPETFPREVLEICRSDSRFLPYFDIPMQHAATSVLRRMGRPGTSRRYRELISEIREALPDSILRTSFLVGFVGETDDEFNELLQFQQAAPIEWVGTFTYSVEEGTPAYARRDQVPDATVAARRKAAIEARQQEITAARLDRFVGRSLDVLIEELVQGEEIALGRGFLHAPEVDGAVVLHTGDLGAPQAAAIAPGAVIPAVITRRNGIDLEARPVAPSGSSPLEANRPD